MQKSTARPFFSHCQAERGESPPARSLQVCHPGSAITAPSVSHQTSWNLHSKVLCPESHPVGPVWTDVVRISIIG